jgi:hypothetical protein
LFANNPYIHYSNNGHLIIKRQLSYTNDDGIDINIFTTNMRLLRGCSQPTNHVLSRDINNYLRITFNIPSYLGEFILTDLTFKISWKEAVPVESGSQISQYEEDYIAIDDSTSITLTSLYTIHSANTLYVVTVRVRARDFPFNPFGAYVSKKGSEIVI